MTTFGGDVACMLSNFSHAPQMKGVKNALSHRGDAGGWYVGGVRESLVWFGE